MTKITTAQTRCIHALAGKAGMDSDELHGMIDGVTGKSSSKELNIHEAILVIDRLRALTGETGMPPVRRTAEPTGRLTYRQLALIRKLTEEMHWAEDPRRLRGYVQARFKVSDPQFLTPGQASMLIEAMKAMLDGGRTERQREN